MTTMPSDLPADVPFTLACAQCDVESPETYEEALQQGWTRIQYDDGPGWNFLGICPDCRPDWEGTLPPQP